MAVTQMTLATKDITDAVDEYLERRGYKRIGDIRHQGNTYLPALDVRVEIDSERIAKLKKELAETKAVLEDLTTERK